MQKFFFNKKLVVTLIGLIVSFLLIAFSISVRNNRSMPPFIVQFGNEAAGVVNTVVSYPVNGVAKVGSNVSDLLNTYEENQKLKNELIVAQNKVDAASVQLDDKQRTIIMQWFMYGGGVLGLGLLLGLVLPHLIPSRKRKDRWMN